MKIEFRKGLIEDINRISSMYQDAIQNMINLGINQWDEIYPNEEDFEEDINKGELYITTSGEDVVASYVINEESGDEYVDGNWNYPDAKYMVIHRLCVNPRYQMQGIGKCMVCEIEKHVKALGFESIRMDVYSKNPYALRLYEGLGYRRVGEVRFRKGVFYLYEKLIC